MPGAHINIGSNLGDRMANIRLAIAGIRRICGVSVESVSDPVGSMAWGYESRNAYINVGIEIDTRLQPAALLEQLLQVESSIDPSPHRRPDGTYADRVIDIDLIAVGDTVIDDPPRLQLPHPRMHLREFVLAPMARIAPAWCHPITGLSAGQMLRQLRCHTSSDHSSTRNAT